MVPGQTGGRMDPWNRTKTIVVDFDDKNDLIGWTGYDVAPDGTKEPTTVGIGQSFWGLLEIVSWLRHGTRLQTAPADGPTDG